VIPDLAVHIRKQSLPLTQLQKGPHAVQRIISVSVLAKKTLFN
jgi:hypothetical protein